MSQSQSEPQEPTGPPAGPQGPPPGDRPPGSPQSAVPPGATPAAPPQAAPPPPQGGPGPAVPYGFPQQQAYGQPYPGQQGYPAAAPMSPSDERTWALAAHLAPLAGGLVGLPFVGPLVVYLMYKDRSAFVRRHAVASTNFQLSLLIYAVVGIVLSLLTLGLGLLVFLPVAALVGVVAIILQILGAVAASRGEEYSYPLTLHLLS